MAKIRDYAVTIETAAVASSVLEMPTHATDDLLLIFFNKDTTAGLPTTPSGWSIVGTYNSAGSGNICYGKRATSSSETVTLSYTSETSITVVISIKNCYGTTVADAVAATVASSDDSTLPITGGTFTPGNNNSLIIGALGTDTGWGPTTLPGWVNIFGGDSGTNSISVSYTYQKIAASITHPGYWGASQDDSRWILCAIRDDGNETEVDPYVDRATTPSVLLSPLVFSTTPDLGTWELVTNDITSIGGKTMTQVDAVAIADSGYNPFRASVRVLSASSKTVLYASQLRRTTNDDLTVQSGVIFGIFRMQVPRDYLDLGKVATGGNLIGIADASNNYKFWTIGAQLSKTTSPFGMNNYAIEVSNSDTTYATSGTISLSAVQDWYFANAGYYAACGVAWSELYLLNKTVLAGGTTSNPLDFTEIAYAVNSGSGYIPLMVADGASATIWTALQFGGGDPVHVGCNLNVFQYPRKADEIDYLNFHVSNNKMGIEFYGLSGDTLSFTNCVFTSDSPYYWQFNASHNAGATLDFSGSSVVGATVTLRSGSDLDRVIFINCPSFTQNSATLTNCTFSNVKITSAGLADMALISDSSFTSSGTGYAIEVGGSADTITFSGNIFTGYAASNGSTGNEAIYVNIGSGTVTINITGGGSTPSIRTAGATVVINNSVTLEINNPSSTFVGARVTISANAGGPETEGTVLMLEETVNDGGVYRAIQSYNFLSNQPVTIRARLIGFIPFETTGIITANGLTVTAIWQVDSIVS